MFLMKLNKYTTLLIIIINHNLVRYHAFYGERKQ